MTVSDIDPKKAEQRHHTESVERQQQVFDRNKKMTVSSIDPKRVEQRRHTESIKMQHQVFDRNKEIATSRKEGKRLAKQKQKQDGQSLTDKGETSQPDLPAKRLDMAEEELTISQSKYNETVFHGRM